MYCKQGRLQAVGRGIVEVGYVQVNYVEVGYVEVVDEVAFHQAATQFFCLFLSNQ
jgi:hypothetical protein